MPEALEEMVAATCPLTATQGETSWKSGTKNGTTVQETETDASGDPKRLTGDQMSRTGDRTVG